MGIGSDGVTETGAVPNGLTGASVINADVEVWLRVHLQKKNLTWPQPEPGVRTLAYG